MNKPSIIKFEKIVIPRGGVIVNTSLCDYSVQREDLSVVAIPATQMAIGIGDVRGANMVALGALLQLRPFLQLPVVVAALKDILPAYRHKYIPLNEKALYEGHNFRG